jgi:hypothetical protein
VRQDRVAVPAVKGNANIPKALAASYPKPHRATAERALTTLLDAYPKVEKELGAERGDLPTAVAFFVVVCFEAYHEASVDPTAYPTIVRQVRDALAGSSAFARASAAEHRALYEQMAILGMLVAMTPKSQERREASAGYLKLFSLDPDAIAIGESGIVKKPRSV